MAVTIYKPNIDVIRQQAEQAREAEKKRNEQGNFRWVDIVLGDNVFRLLPPTNSRGLIFKLVSNHYFHETPFKGKIDKQRCLVQMHPEVPGITCPICDIGDRILAQRPDLEIKRWHRPGTNYYGQAISRKDEAQLPLARIVRCTPGVKNWVAQQMELAWAQGIDITDFQKGLDINVVKSEKETKRGKRTEYKPAIASLMGPTPVLTQLPQGMTLEQVIEKIVESMYDLDQIWQLPDDETIAKINKAASDIYSYYMKDMYAQPGAQVQVPGRGFYQPSQTQSWQAPPQQMPPQSMPVQPEVPVTQAQMPANVSFASPQQSAMTAVEAASSAVAIAMGQQPPQQQQFPQVPPSSGPTDRPGCWGGATPREDGGLGYDSESENCLMCAHELTCMDACKAGTA